MKKMKKMTTMMMENISVMKKAFLLFVFIVFGVATSFCQSYKDAFRADICNCISDQENVTYKSLKNLYSKCLRENMPKYATQIDASIPDTTMTVKMQLGQLKRQALIINYEIELLNTCEVYFEIVEKGREDQLGTVQYDDRKMKRYNETIAMTPNSYTLVQRGVSYLAQGNYTDAISDYKAALEINPNFYQAYLYWGWTLEKQNKYTEAAAMYRRMKSTRYDVLSMTLQTIAMYKAGSNVYLTDDNLWYNTSTTNEIPSSRRQSSSITEQDISRRSRAQDSSSRGLSPRNSKRKQPPKKASPTKKPKTEKIRNLFDLDGDDGLE